MAKPVQTYMLKLIEMKPRLELGQGWSKQEGSGGEHCDNANVSHPTRSSSSPLLPCLNWSRSAFMLTLACLLHLAQQGDFAFAHNNKERFFLTAAPLLQETHPSTPIEPITPRAKRSSYKKMKIKSSRISPATAPNYLPRILVPEFSAYLPVYGPSLYNINKIQLLPPSGPVKPFKHNVRENGLRPAVSAEPIVPATPRHPVEMIERSIRVALPHPEDKPQMITIAKRNERANNFTVTKRPKIYMFEDDVVTRLDRDEFKPARQTNLRSQSEPSTPPKVDYRWHGSTSTALITTSAVVKPVKPKSWSTSTRAQPTPPPTTTTTTPPPTTTQSVPASIFSDPLWATRPQAQVLRTNSNRSSRERKPNGKRNRNDSNDAQRCTAQKCRLPHCNCGSSTIPGGLKVKDIPQLVMITFDDSVNDLNIDLYKEIFDDLVNPNGCPALGTFYVSHEWTDYSMVQNLYAKGHEMASHTITHSFGEKFSKEKWLNEVNGQREILHLYGGVPYHEVRGMRAPFLQPGGNNQFAMLHEANFTYDSSLPVFENNPPFWPYTLDYALNHDCMIAPCPTKSFAGLWEVGMVMLVDYRGGRCSMVDACAHPATEEEVYQNLLKNFKRHYESNRAPFGLYFHSAWFNTQHYRKGFMRFIKTLNELQDVYFVTKWQMLQWMQTPTPLSRSQSFPPFQCDYSDRQACPKPKVCNASFRDGPRYLKTCQKCPKSYPWVKR